MKPPMSIMFEMRSLANLFRRKIGSIGVDVDNNVTMMHGWIIDYLLEHEEEEIMQRDLELALSMRRSSVSRALRLMEKNEMIEREPVDYDARLKRIRLTDKAAKARIVVAEDSEKIEREMIKNIPQEELDVFLKVISKMKENLK